MSDIQGLESAIKLAHERGCVLVELRIQHCEALLEVLKEQEETICAYAELLIKYGHEFTEGQ